MEILVNNNLYSKKVLDFYKCIYNNSCGVTKENAIYGALIPLYYIKNYANHLLFSEYLYIPLKETLYRDYINFKFTIFPEPEIIFYQNINGITFKGGMFKCMDKGDNIKYINLLYNCRVFIKWHFLKYLEVNNIHPSFYNYQNKYMNSEIYLNEIIYKIISIDMEYVYEGSGDSLMI